MANEFLLVTQGISASAMFGLAGWLLWLNFSSPVHRAFATVLTLRGLQVSFFMAGAFASSESMVTYWSVLAEYMFLLIPFALGYFFLVYVRPRHEKWWRITVLVGAVLVLLLYLMDHCLNRCEIPGSAPALGPLAMVSFGGPLATGLVGMGIAWAIRRQHGVVARKASMLVSASLVLNALFDAILSWSVMIRLGWGGVVDYYVPNGWQGAESLLFGVAIVPASIGFALLLVEYRKRNRMEAQGLVFVVATVVAVISAAFVGFVGGVIGVNWSLFVVGLWRLVPVSFVAYALLRHRVIGIDLHVKAVLRSSTIVAFFGIAFFVGSEVLEAWINVSSTLLGIVAAGGITLALKPIQALAHSFSERAFPNAKPVLELSDEDRLNMFREQALLVWMDGVVGRKERILLDRLTSRLGLTTRQATKIEAEAERQYLENQG